MGRSRLRRWIAVAAGIVVLAMVVAAVVMVLRPDDDDDSAHGPSGTAGTPSASAGAPGGHTAGFPTGSGAGPDTGTAPGAGATSADTAGEDTAAAPADTPEPSAGPDVPSTVPRTRTLPGSSGWSVVALQPPQPATVPGGDDTPYRVIRFDPATGALLTAPVPAMTATRLVALVVADGWVILRPQDAVAGYAVSPTGQVTTLGGLLADGQLALPGPDEGHLWVADRERPGTPTFDLVGPDGAPTGERVEIPAVLATSGAFGVAPDGTGSLLTTGVGGTYLAGPDGLRLITTGAVAATGPTAFVVHECDDSGVCGYFAVDRDSGRRHPIDSLGPGPITPRGVVSPDGRTAALTTRTDYGNLAVDLVDLRTGRRLTELEIPHSATWQNRAPLAVFAPDGRYALVRTPTNVIPIEVADGAVLPPLPLPETQALVVVPGG